MPDTTTPTAPATRRTAPPIPLARITAVELRKMVNTRSGLWLIASIAIVAVLTTGSAILWAPDAELTYATFVTAIRSPVVVILPLIAILAVTSEWSQRTGLTTFTLIPHRNRSIAAKAIAAVIIAIAALAVSFAVGAIGALLNAAITGATPVWDLTISQGLQVGLGMVVSLLFGFAIGVLIRASTGAIVTYFITTLLLPGLLLLLALNQQWFSDLHPWVDLQFAVSRLFTFSQPMTGEHWANIGVAGTIWLLIPLLVGLRQVMTAEIK